MKGKYTACTPNGFIKPRFFVQFLNVVPFTPSSTHVSCPLPHIRRHWYYDHNVYRSGEGPYFPRSHRVVNKSMNKQGRFVAVLTGAGISAESGIPTFRGKDRLWENHRVVDVACPAAYARNPQLVQQFYNQRRRALLAPSVKPNAAHLALAKLERQYDAGSVVIITQNVDNLHERAGSKRIFHIHGELLKVRCSVTGEVFEIKEDVVHGQTRCHCCGKTSTLRPHIVWFDEVPFYMDEIQEIMKCTALFVAIGTSGNVYPAAGLATMAKSYGARTLEMNLEPGENCSDFDECVYGKASEIVPAWVERLLQSN
ncbi:putative NAD dependent deacetylase [Trypanosoma vivax]|nr:putative NAD dependent deacetylase [Trypanosoma vivax]